MKKIKEIQRILNERNKAIGDALARPGEEVDPDVEQEYAELQAQQDAMTDEERAEEKRREAEEAEGERAAAALKIQKWKRQKKAKKEVAARRAAVPKIQASMRRRLVKKKLFKKYESEMDKARVERTAASVAAPLPPPPYPGARGPPPSYLSSASLSIFILGFYTDTKETWRGKKCKEETNRNTILYRSPDIRWSMGV